MTHIIPYETLWCYMVTESRLGVPNLGPDQRPKKNRESSAKANCEESRVDFRRRSQVGKSTQLPASVN